MQYYDVFNGDADGLCALVQLRNAEPRDSILVTGVKRDIKLLSQIRPQAHDVVTVLDISMDKNKKDLLRILETGCEVFYCDHHLSGEIPHNRHLTALINADSNVCTSLLINGHLKGQFSEWAMVGAFGDNMQTGARALAKQAGLNEQQIQQLDDLGVYINYNGYGAALEDLHFRPAELYHELAKYASPFDFMHNNKPVFDKLADGYRDDMAKARALPPEQALYHAAVYVLPNEKWARRVSGVYGNELANQSPDRAHAVLTELGDGSYIVSVRAPLTNKQGAADICQQFHSGGGRAGAAGINELPQADVQRFIDIFSNYYA